MRLSLLVLATTPAVLLIAGLAAAQTPAPAASAAPTATSAPPAPAAAPAPPAAPVAAPGVADEVQLKDGRAFRGTITESAPGDHFDLLLPSGQVRRFPASDVAYAGPAANAPSGPPATPAPAPTTAPAPAPSAATAPPAATAEPAPGIVPPDAGTPGPWRREEFYRRAPDAPASSWQVSGLLGFEIEARAGVMLPDAISPVLAPNLYPGAGNPSASGLQKDPTGQILRGTESPYTLDPVAISIAAGYRFLPYLSAGAFFDYANFEVQDGTDQGSADSTSQLERQVWQLGAYVRLYGVAQNAMHPGFPYLPGSIFDRLQPWVELGAGYAQDTASYVRGSTVCTSTTGVGPCPQSYYLSYNGIVTNLRVGLDWRLAPIFSVGPVLGYGHTFGINSCADSELASADPITAGTKPANTCAPSNGVPSPSTANDYGIFFGGIYAKVTLGPDVR
jgi:hypothetical protein